MILPAWFDHLKESFSHKEVQFMLCSSVKTSCPPVENVSETPVETLYYKTEIQTATIIVIN